MLQDGTGCHTVVKHGVTQCYKVLRGVRLC